MRRTACVLAACLLSFLSGACKAKTAIAQAMASHDVSTRGFTDVLKTNAEEKYTPPADGHLTGTQVENFIKIRQRAKVIEDVGRRELAEQAKNSEGKQNGLSDFIKGSRSMATLISADMRASQELGLNSAEYEWVKQQVIDASMAAGGDQGILVGRKVAAADRADLQKHYDDAPDAESKKIYAGLIADSEKNEKEAEAAVEPQTPAVVYNKQLLAKYEDAIRPFMELMLSGTGHEEEIQNAITKGKEAMTGTTKTP